ncbi:hypothetical protein [Kribbella antiqua]|uniref:hypothetical protein n=1 Tax=Kribbella antiqua TaxID=2512217 RepID=UPI001045D537|nr:hypothetical protein [Kribbella antiqua]
MSDAREGQRAAAGYLADLSRFFRRVHAVELPAGQTLAALHLPEDGDQQLQDVLLATRPLADYRYPSQQATTAHALELLSDPDRPGPSPDL